MPSKDPLPRDEAARGGFRWKPRQVWTLLQRTAREFAEDKVPKQAAALAYYALFALGPILFIAITIAGLVFGAEAARQAITGEVTRLMGASGGEAVDTLLAASERGGGTLLATAIGAVVLLFGAAGVFGQLKEALNRVWEVELKDLGSWKAKLVRVVRKNFLSLVSVIGVGFLLLTSLVISAALTAIGRYAEGLLPGAAILWLVVNALVSVGVVSTLFALMYKFLPDTRVAWRDVGVGALVTGVLFSVGQVLIGLYLGAGPLTTRYGAAGAVVVALVWVYYSSLILFFGAEFTQVYANLYGSRVRPDEDAIDLETATAAKQDAPDREGTREKHTGRGRGAS